MTRAPWFNGRKRKEFRHPEKVLNKWKIIWGCEKNRGEEVWKLERTQSSRIPNSSHEIAFLPNSLISSFVFMSLYTSLLGCGFRSEKQLYSCSVLWINIFQASSSISNTVFLLSFPKSSQFPAFFFQSLVSFILRPSISQSFMRTLWLCFQTVWNKEERN